MRAIAEEDETYRCNDMPPPPAESIKLWLPSDLDPQDRPISCIAGLVDMEAKLCEAQCHEALNNICDRLHSKKHLIDRWNKHVTGKNKSTRAQVLIARIGDCVTTSFEKVLSCVGGFMGTGGGGGVW